jgi:toxin ParE1/3/4
VASIRRDLETLNSHPGIGSPAFGDRLGLPGLRAWRVTDFPMLIFYIEREDHLDVVRILGERQDIGTIMNSEP